jgi:hypothetical protein
MAVTIHQAGGEIDEVKQRGRLVVKNKGRHETYRDLLITRAEVCPVAATYQLNVRTADPRGRMFRCGQIVEFGRCQELAARDASCSLTQPITCFTPSF